MRQALHVSGVVVGAAGVARLQRPARTCGAGLLDQGLQRGSVALLHGMFKLVQRGTKVCDLGEHLHVVGTKDVATPQDRWRQCVRSRESPGLPCLKTQRLGAVRSVR